MDRASEHAFEAFVRDASPGLVRTAFLMVGDRGHAEDLVQTTFVRLVGRFRSDDPRPVALARTILANLVKDRRRQRDRRVIETNLEPIVESSRVSAIDPRFDAVVERDRLMSAVRRLPNRQRAVLVLRFYDDMSVEDVAAAIGCSTGTVKSTTSDALRNLRRILASTKENSHAIRR